MTQRPLSKRKILSLLLGQQISQKIAKCRILVVGAGGIGCQLIKNLVKSGYKHITLLDFDKIEVTNLNRQFYFRKQHVGQSKAETVEQVILKLDSSVKIKAIDQSIYHPNFNFLFYKEFDLIFSCLDNMKARQHLAAQATKHGKPLIDAGTMSYFGQAYSSIRFKTSCHNCNPTHSEQTPAFCTIRSHPQQPVHCATYAKNFYNSFFGVNQAQALSDNLKFNKYVTSDHLTEAKMESIAKELFEEIFNKGIHDRDLEGNKIDFVRKLSGKEASQLTKIVENPQKSTFNREEYQKNVTSPYRQEQLWSISQYYHRFLQSTINLLKRKLTQSSPSSFEKDDDDCMALILCIANLRTYNFMNQESEHNKHKYLTYYQCKDLIGKVFPAIASANAIAAALQAREAVNIIANKYDQLRYISFGNRSDERLSPSFQGSSNAECHVCSEKIVYTAVTCNMNITTYHQLQTFTGVNFFTKNRDVTCGPITIIRSSKKGAQPNRQKMLNFIPQMIHNGILQLKFEPQMNEPQYTVHVSVVHDEKEKYIRILHQNQSRKTIFKQLKTYFRRARGEIVSNNSYQLQINGGYQL